MKSYITLTIEVEHPDEVPYEYIQHKITQQVGDLFCDSEEVMYEVSAVIGGVSIRNEEELNDWDDYDYMED